MSGRHAIVVGGTSGIGLATAQVLAAGGWEVVATGATAAEVTHAQATASGPRLAFDRLDVTDEAAVTDFFSNPAPLGLLFCAAGVGSNPSEYTDAGFRRTMEVNLMGTMRCCYAAHPRLVGASGAIVMVASMMSFFGTARGPAYAASKGAIVQFMRSLAIAWAPEGIRVNAVAPGWIDTPMTRGLQTDAGYNRRVLDRSPMGRWGTPSEVGEVVAFLASQRASFVNGAVIPVDGGYLAVGV